MLFLFMHLLTNYCLSKYVDGGEMSQNCRTKQDGRNIQKSPEFNHMLKAGPTAQGLPQSGFEYLQGQRFLSFSEFLFQYLTTLKVFPCIVLHLVSVDSHPSAALDTLYTDKSAQELVQEESNSAMFWRESNHLLTNFLRFLPNWITIWSWALYIPVLPFVDSFQASKIHEIMIFQKSFHAGIGHSLYLKHSLFKQANRSSISNPLTHWNITIY